MAWGRVAGWVLDHPTPVGVALAVVVLLALVVGVPPRIEPNLLALLPPDDPASVALTDLHEREGGANLVTLAFEGEPEAVGPFLDELAERLERSPKIRFAVHDLDEALATKIGLLQLEAADLEELTLRLKGALALGAALNPVVVQRLMAMGEVTQRIESAGDRSWVPGGRGSGRLLVRPTGSSHDPQFSVALIEELEAEVAQLLEGHPGVTQTWVGGAYRHNVEDYRGIRRDLWWTSGASLLLVLLVISLAFRSPRAVVLVAVPLVMSLIVTLGLARILVGSLNTYTSLGTAILVGLGIDFAIHLVGRYRELHATGLSVRDSVMQAWDRVGPPCATAAMTSAAGFLALAAADFRGFSQLGVLLAVGLVVALGMMVITLPLLIPVLDPDPPLLRGTRQHDGASTSTYAVAPGLLAGIVVLTVVVGIARLPSLEWEYDVSALRRDGLAYQELDEAERALARESYSPVLVRFDDDEALAAATSRVEALQEEGRLPHIQRAVSIETVLPVDQGTRLAALRDLQELLDHPNLRYLPPPLVEQLRPLDGVPLTPITREDLPKPVRSLLGAENEDDYRLLLLPRGNMWDLRQAAALADEVGLAVADRPAAGEYVALGALYRVMLRDMPIVGFLAFVMVTLLTSLDLRRPVWVLGAVSTLVAGMVWAGAALEVAGVRLTMVNIVGIPILLGIGIDVVIHLLHRLVEEGPGGVRRALSTTGIAAGISALTTILSFLSLTLAGNRGVRSLGLLVVIGLVAVFLASALLMPTAWAAAWKVTGRAPADQGE